MGIGLEIKRLREQSGLSAAKFSELINLDVERLRKWEQKDLTPKFDDRQKLEVFFGMSLDELIKLENIPSHIFNRREAPKEIQEKSVTVSNDYLIQRRNLKNTREPYMVPFFPVKAQAGYVKAIDQSVFMDTLERYALPPGINPHGAVWTYWEIEGDSMEDTFISGDIILTSQVNHLDWEENLRNFYVYVIVTMEQVLIKRIAYKNPHEWILISDNEERYKQRLIKMEDVKELWVYRRTWASRAKPPKMFKIDASL